MATLSFISYIKVYLQPVYITVISLPSLLFTSSVRTGPVSRIESIYRIRNIPARYDSAEECRRFIEGVLSDSGNPCTINLRSFAINIPQNTAHSTRTVTFSLKHFVPGCLAPNSHDEWIFKAFGDESRRTRESLTIDTHFIGLTILYCPKAGNHHIEYRLISNSFKAEC